MKVIVATLSPTTSQLKAHVRRQLAKRPEPGKVFAVRSSVRWVDGEGIDVDGRYFRIAWCPSPLELRQRLAEATQEEGLLVLTPLDGPELGKDVLARLASGKVDGLRSWDVVHELFRAKEIDPQVLRHGWMADAIVAAAENGNPSPVPAGVLDLQTAWRFLLQQLLDWSEASIDLESLLRWTIDPRRLERYAELGQAIRSPIAQHLRDAAGSVAELVLAVVDAGHGGSAVAIGLACDVVFPLGSAPFAEGAVRLERYLLDRQVGPDAARQWAKASAALIASLEREQRSELVANQLRAAEKILVDIKADSLIVRSDLLPRGFEDRLAVFADVTRLWLKGSSSAFLSSVENSLRSVMSHREARLQSDRVERVRMAIRLLRWLHQSIAPEGGSLSSLVGSYIDEGGYVDWARGLLSGEGLAELADAFTRLAEAVTERREQFNRTFATALDTYTRTGSTREELIGVEHVLDRVVAPLARNVPVLLVVVDGMSQAVFAELAQDLSTSGWVQVTNEQSRLGVALSTIPSVTEYARTSLLCGRLARGSQPEAVQGFRSHRGLLEACGSGSREPLLYHKAELVEGEDLAADLRSTIASKTDRTLAVVVNAVDDYLAKGDQVQPRWTIDYIKVLRPLFHAAADAGRAVVLASDHGHVLHRDATYQKSDRGERWRSAVGPDAEMATHEILMEGERVLADGGRLRAAWSEKVYYNNKKHGYHGGVSPQEMLAPVAVVIPARLTAPQGWSEVPPNRPLWWDVSVDLPSTVAAASMTASPAKEKGQRTAKEPPTLFDPPPQEILTLGGPPAPVKTMLLPATSVPAAVPDWVGGLLASPTFASQRRAAARTSIDDDRIRTILAALATRGGRMLRPALARAANVPPVRLPGVLAALRRLMNVEGIDVLAVDEASDSVTLDVERLKVQFDLK